MKTRNLFILLFFVPVFLSAQSQTYFQQDVAYKINVDLNTETKMLKGVQNFTYKNNSPDKLDYIWFHLYPNAFKDQSTPYAKQMVKERRWDFAESKPEEKGWMTAEFKSNGKILKQELKEDAIDEVKVYLDRSLNPGESISLEIPFEVKLPKVFSRIGYETTGFAITQWYPKVVVYDKYGWHPDSYLDQGEFYGEFGTFDVTFTLPRNYVMDATGLLEDSPAEQAFMDSLANDLTTYYSLSDSARTSYRKNLTEIRSSKLDLSSRKTVSFHAENVQDFAMFCSKDASVQKMTNSDGVVSYVLIQPSNLDSWKDAAKFAQETLEYYGKYVGKYPHPKASVVDGALDAGGGMEYPMITVISSPNPDGLLLLDMVITHEVGHNWFQGILGSNERANAWMDEGMNSFYEMKTMDAKYGRDKSFIIDPDKIPAIGSFLRPLGEREYFITGLHVIMWKGVDKPNNLPAPEYDTNGNEVIVYHKTAMTMSGLQWYLGEQKYDRLVQTYFEKWKFKHPYPEDFYALASEIAGEDLTWFFDQWMKTTKYNDFVVDDITTSKSGDQYRTIVKIKNKGTMTMPSPVFLTTESGEKLEARWDPRKSDEVAFTHNSPVKKVEVNENQDILELNYKNNSSTFNYAFHPLLSIPTLNRYDANIFPVVNYEGQKDKFQLGAGFWAGEPLTGPEFHFTTLYYAPNSNSIGYRNHFRYRMPRLILNYSDIGWNLFDQEGFSKQEVYFRSKYDNALSYIASGEIGFGHYKNYDMAYMDKNIYQNAEYSTVDVKLFSQYSTREYRYNLMLGISKGLKVLKGQFDFTKVEAELNNRYKFTSKDFIESRIYARQADGSIPVKEGYFLGGSADPRRNTMFLSRSGNFSVLNKMGSGKGLGLYGYAANNDTVLVGKAGLSTRLTLTTELLPVSIFADAGSVGQDFGKAAGSSWYFDAGLSYKIAFMQIHLPLWVSKPSGSENNFAFRFFFEIDVVKAVTDIIE